MTNKKKIVSRILLVIVALTLISFCFIGTTLARYTSENSGSATTGVAKWDVTITPSDDAPAVFGDLTPSMAEYEEGETRSNPTGRKQVATLHNSGEVDAEVTLTAGTAVIKNASDEDPTYGTGLVLDESGSFGESAPTAADVARLFSVKLFYGTSPTASDAAEINSGAEFTLATGGAPVYIFAEVTWTSAGSDYYSTQTAQYSDKLDTWVGENVETVSYTITYTAVQGEQIPASA